MQSSRCGHLLLLAVPLPTPCPSSVLPLASRLPLQGCHFLSLCPKNNFSEGDSSAIFPGWQWSYDSCWIFCLSMLALSGSVSSVFILFGGHRCRTLGGGDTYDSGSVSVTPTSGTAISSLLLIYYWYNLHFVLFSPGLGGVSSKL